ncbi:MAG: hypothetical protein SFU85_03535 [Candidatus Methylacidiphilales bacterium]|nr:hypothetical protein [Candidatus Methylacidiphilales bacterium]
MERRRTSRHSRRSSPSPGIPLFSKGKPHKKRKSAVRLDLSDSSSSGSVVLSERSNLWALVFTVLFISGLSTYLVVDNWPKIVDWWNHLGVPGEEQEVVQVSGDLPLQAPATAPATSTPAPESPGRSRTALAMEFKPKALAEALQKASLALDAAKFGKHEEARHLIDEAYQLDPTFVGWWYLSGRVASQAGDLVRMHSDLVESIRREEVVLPSILMMGDLGSLAGQFDFAAAQYKRAHELIPEEPWFLVRLSVALRGKGDTAGAIQAAKAAAQLPNASWALAWQHLAEREAGGPAPADLAAALAGNTTGNRASWWWLAAVEAGRSEQREEMEQALVHFREMANDDVSICVAIDPWCRRWAREAEWADKLPGYPGLPRERVDDFRARVPANP